MLIALFTILFLGGGSTGMLDYIADARGEVRTVMEKDDRRKEVLATLKAMKKRTNTRNKVVKNAIKDLGRLLNQDEVSEADIDTIWYRYFSQREAYNRDMLDLRFELIDQMTREEWQQVFGEKQEN